MGDRGHRVDCPAIGVGGVHSGQFPQDHPSAGERLTAEQGVALARNVINKYSASSDKPSVQLALRVINGAHERDKLRDALHEAISNWETLAIDWRGDDHPHLERIAELRKLLAP